MLQHELTTVGFEDFQSKEFFDKAVASYVDYNSQRIQLRKSLASGQIPKDKHASELQRLRLELDRNRWELLTDEILLPQQKQQVEKLALSQLVSQRGIAACLSAGELSRKLKINDDTKGKIKNLSKKRAEEIQVKMEELVDEIDRKLKSQLSRKEYEELVSLISIDGNRLDCQFPILILR